MTQSDPGRHAARIFVASPIYNDQCFGSYTNSLLGLQNALLQRGHEFTFEWTKNVSAIARARNMLFNRFLQDTRATHLLFVDADIAFEANDVVRMLEYDYELMAALYPKKVISWANVARAAREHPDLPAGSLPFVAGAFGTFNLLPGDQEIPIDRPFPIASAGTGLMLIRRNVFTQMVDAYPDLMLRIGEGEVPYFPGVDRLPALFNEMTTVGGRILGEDLSFCERWRAIGGQVHGCAWFTIRHLGTYEYACDIRSMAQLRLVVQ
ncbi:hypothetical protein FAZ95_36625 [Trinickia violacea]|uniref:Glycosyltransferase family 2 protein n=1 Tax=Trinickia violacea TaxID=2571746 RepID=A0A4P8J0J1_9BURK|nr:hypothetical protein [Trinickia violacea]QCP54441.1 hypothetical protein FAZ95_36625 [Trinickia violacea]